MSIWIDPIPEYSGGFLFGKKSKAIKLFTANSSLLAELMKIVRMDDGTYQSVAFVGHSGGGEKARIDDGHLIFRFNFNTCFFPEFSYCSVN